MVVFLKMPRKEQIAAEEGSVLGHVAQGDVEVAALLRHSLDLKKDITGWYGFLELIYFP